MPVKSKIVTQLSENNIGVDVPTSGGFTILILGKWGIYIYIYIKYIWYIYIIVDSQTAEELHWKPLKHTTINQKDLLQYKCTYKYHFTSSV